MPTTLPARIPPIDQTADFLGFLRALLGMYGLLAIVIALVIAFNAAGGVFTGRTLAASIVIATGTDLPEPDNARVGLLDWPESVAF